MTGFLSSLEPGHAHATELTHPALWPKRSAARLQMEHWTPEHLDPRCMHPDTVTLFVVEMGYRTRERPRAIYEICCLLASLGAPPAAIRQFLLSRYNGDQRQGAKSIIRCIAYLHQELALTRAQITKVVTHNSRIFDYSLERTIEPRVRLFKEYWGVEAPAVGAAVRQNPRMLWVRPTSSCSCTTVHQWPVGAPCSPTHGACRACAPCVRAVPARPGVQPTSFANLQELV